MKIGPRQGEKFTLPQAAGQSDIHDGERPQLLCCVQITLKLPQAQRDCSAFFCLGYITEPCRVKGYLPIPTGFIQAPPKEQMDTPHAPGAKSVLNKPFVKRLDSPGSQVDQPRPTNTGDNVVVNQIAVAALGVGAPFADALGEP